MEVEHHLVELPIGVGEVYICGAETLEVVLG
jgi:hypothetical protein